MEARGEKLLQDLASQERSLSSKVDEAKKEAAQIIEKAQAEAQTLIAKAREKGQALKKEQAAKSESEAQSARQETLGGVKSDVDKLEQKAKKNIDKARNLVLERVLP